jgi:4-amino-4-deoxy-L-arabinose transferase-like glycosyltransferase
VLLAGRYLTGRLVYNPLAGVLAAVYALGTPMILDLCHFFNLDAPLAGIVALKLWALLASDRFSRRRESIPGGLLVGASAMVTLHPVS